VSAVTKSAFPTKPTTPAVESQKEKEQALSRAREEEEREAAATASRIRLEDFATKMKRQHEEARKLALDTSDVQTATQGLVEENTGKSTVASKKKGALDVPLGSLTHLGRTSMLGPFVKGSAVEEHVLSDVQEIVELDLARLSEENHLEGRTQMEARVSTDTKSDGEG
jgi:hypothetical protein